MPVISEPFRFPALNLQKDNCVPVFCCNINLYLGTLVIAFGDPIALTLQIGSSYIVSLFTGPHPARTIYQNSSCCKIFSKLQFDIRVKETLVSNCERPSMNLAMPMLLDRFSVLRRSIALILGKIILGKLAIIHLHDPVSGNFGDDRGGRYGDAPRIAFDNGLLGNGNKNTMWSVDEQIIGGQGQIQCGFLHCHQCRLKYVPFVNKRSLDNAESDGKGFLPYDLGKAVSLLGRKLLRIFDFLVLVIRGEYHGRRNNGARKWTSAHLINAGY